MTPDPELITVGIALLTALGALWTTRSRSRTDVVQSYDWLVDQLQEERDGNTKKIQTLEDRVETLTTEVRDVRTALGAAQREAEFRYTELMNYRNIVGEHEALIAGQRSEIADHKARIAALEGALVEVGVDPRGIDHRNNQGGR